ncbi:MAG: hypothetical protein ABMA64_29405, partial [Myxococcota bacterium]
MKPLFRRLLLLLGLALALLGSTSPAAAQGVGQWVSPGLLARDHADLEGLTNCTKCHAPMMGVTTERCTACHEEVAEQIRTKSGFHANKANKCGTCHTDHKGRDYQLARLELTPLQHLNETGFPLEGAHLQAKCEDCHTTGKWADVEPECWTCHETPHGEKEHVDLGTCDDCHGAASWDVASIDRAVFDHDDKAQADYPLEGAHADVPCLECHLEGLFVPTLFDACTSCHNDPHRAPRISNDCESCHTVNQWFVDEFDHDLTNWKLEGLHTEVGCDKCHKSSATKPLPHDTCENCHKDIHHKQFTPRTCDTCHTIVDIDFKIPSYDHGKTQFPLVGKHVEVKCDECHGLGPSATYVPLDHADCDACHEDVHEGKFEPTDCAACHVETGWEVEGFNHDRTDFPLKGKHIEVECEECHPNEQWSGIAHDTCDQCHEDHPHGTAFAPPTCDECHEEADWVAITFAHATETKFDPSPQHDETPCKECHLEMDHFEGLAMECTACHTDDTPPGHFEGECSDCHRTAGWRPADLGGRPHDITGYALVGTHSQLACEDCHGAAPLPLFAG